MTASEKVKKAKIGLLYTQPFFATIAMNLKFIETMEVKTACTDGVVLKYNPKFIDGLTVDKTKGLIAHEVMHVAYMHHTRRKGRNPGKWNKACDYAINGMLINAKFDLPNGGCVDTSGTFKDKSADIIYTMLPDDQNDKDKNGKGDSDPGNDGGVQDAPAKTKEEMQLHEQNAKNIVQRAAMVSKAAGKLPAEFEHLVAQLLEPVVNWKDVLNEFITEKTRNDYTFSKPSKGYLSQGLYLPSLQSQDKGKFVLVIDTSASVDDQLLNEFGGEMQSILSEVAEHITVYHVDTKIQKIEEFEADDEMKLKAKGRGGTDFRPAFNHIDKIGLEAACLVYFTDGYCNLFPADPGYPVLWAVYNNPEFKPPFGDVVKVN